MNQQLAIVTLLAVCYAHTDDKATATVNGEAHSGISPKLDKSDKKFFGKDYPWDKRPAVDVLHFKHPYPVVQDSGDFDRDYVKDENSDNGEWKAQSEYDRLRHEMNRQKAELARALKAKEDAEDELKHAMKRKEEATEIRRQLENAPEPVVEKETSSSRIPFTGSGGAERVSRTPGGVSSAGQVRIATEETKRAMKHLEDCKEELEKARERLKKLMKELEEAKKEQDQRERVLEADESHVKIAKREKERFDNNVKKEYDEYMAARTAYLQQQALIAKMEADLKVAAEKVKAMRDAEDPNGGVYNTGDHKSAAKSVVSPLASFLLAIVAAISCILH